MNVGKIFEADFSKSVPSEHLVYRLPDPAQSFGGSNTLRFSRRNPFDYILFDTVNRNLYALELKTVKLKSISFERSKDDKGDIHYYQIEGLNIWNQYSGVICGFVIEFRSIETTAFISIEEFNKLIKLIDKKSFSFGDLTTYGITHYIIPQKKLRTHYKYDVGSFLEQTRDLK